MKTLDSMESDTQLDFADGIVKYKVYQRRPRESRGGQMAVQQVDGFGIVSKQQNEQDSNNRV